MFYVKKADYDSSNIVTKLDEFFSEQNEVTSVVREAIQNVIDASVKSDGKTARARFSFKEIAWEDFKNYINTDDGFSMNDHWQSPALKSHKKDHSNQAVRALIIEDYNTTGLTGSFDKDEENSESNLVNFWWNSGLGNKGKGTLGNAGVGKITFTAASEMRTMWALSRRLNDETDPKVLLGYTDLPYHHVNGQSYLGYARYGIEEELPDGKKALNPIVDQKQINAFETTFGLDRSDPGLSIIIPAISTEFRQDTIVDAVLEHYFWAIINQDLVVEVVSDDGNSRMLDSISIQELITEQDLGNGLLAKRIKHAVAANLLMKSKSPTVFLGLEPVVGQDLKKYIFEKEQISDENLNLMLEYFDAGQMIMASFKVPFKDRRDGHKKNGIVNIFFKKLSSREEAPKEFMRLSISLTRMANSLARSLPKNVYCFVMIEEADMSDFVLSAEDVAHTTLTKRQFNKKKLFEPVEALDFISNISEKFFSILSREDEEKPVIEGFDEHIFSIQLPDGSPQPNDEETTEEEEREVEEEQQQEEEEEDRVVPPDIDIEERKTPIFAQRELLEESGVEISSLDILPSLVEQGAIELPLKMQIKCAYQTLNGPNEAWKLYSKYDFEIGKDIKVVHEADGPVEIIQKELNDLSLSINSSKFTIKISGFDANRDLLTNVRVE